jgi:Tfp pilus assembly protein PilX
MKRLIWGDQKGVVLIVALIMLLVLTLIGISSISSTFYETKISGNDRSGANAFYAAEGGVDVGINRLPDISSYGPSTIGGDETYRSGKMTPATPQPLVYLGAMGRPGYDVTTWESLRYLINATGQSFGAMKEIEVQVSYGPVKAGTSYNN